jgi:hypothetical protein
LPARAPGRSVEERRGYARGRGPLDLTVVATLLALAGLALLAVSAVIALRGIAGRLRPPTPVVSA